MSGIGSVKKLAGSRFLNLYQLEAKRRDGESFDYFLASRISQPEKLKAVTGENRADGVAVFAVDGQDRVVLVRQYRYPVGRYVYELPAGLVEPGEEPGRAAIRELFEETGLTLEPLQLENGYERPYFTTVGMTDECCSTVFGYVSGILSSEGEEDTEDIEALLVDREEAKRILKEERVAIMDAYMLMHFVADDDPFAFLEK